MYKTKRSKEKNLKEEKAKKTFIGTKGKNNVYSLSLKLKYETHFLDKNYFSIIMQKKEAFALKSEP